jgi:hypothetical protein
MGGSDLFCQNNPRLIEHKIIEFINEMKERQGIFNNTQLCCWRVSVLQNK